LSIEQKTLAEERIKAAGLENQIRVHLLDYREIPAEFEKAFDAFVSVEMLEVSSYIFCFIQVLTETHQACRSEILHPLFQTC
jgi:cyclopropane fatty-acyl-phospholipid synthase-like methyltransferase